MARMNNNIIVAAIVFVFMALGVTFLCLEQCATPGLTIPAETQARTWALSLQMTPIAVSCRQTGCEAECAVRTESGIYSISCYVGCTSCRDAMPGECKLLNGVVK